MRSDPHRGFGDARRPGMLGAATAYRNGAGRKPSRGAAAVPAVSLTLADGDYVGVARLVVAGLTAQLGLRFETVEKLQTAVEAVLLRVFRDSRHATMGIVSDARRLTVSIGPSASSALARRFPGQGGMALGALLDRLVDGVTVEREPIQSIALHIDLAGKPT